MKRLIKKLMVIVAVMIMALSTLSLTACSGNGTRLELTVKVYDSSQGKVVSRTMDVDLYKSVAPRTVDAIIKYAKDGYYDGMTFYVMTSFDGSSAYTSQIMFGDYTYDAVDKVLKLSDTFGEKPFLDGEFENAGVVGNNLKNEKGSIGLWRNWTAYDNTYKVTNSLGSGRATWYMPTATSEIAAYKDWFCVFAQIDLTNTDNSKAMDLIVKAFDSSDDIKEYEIYYTGEYDAEKANENYGLKFNYMSEVLFSEDDVEDLFKAEGAQYTAYNHQTIRVPLAPETEEFAVKIVSANMK